MIKFSAEFISTDLKDCVSFFILLVFCIFAIVEADVVVVVVVSTNAFGDKISFVDLFFNKKSVSSNDVSKFCVFNCTNEVSDDLEDDNDEDDKDDWLDVEAVENFSLSSIIIETKYKTKKLINYLL